MIFKTLILEAKYLYDIGLTNGYIYNNESKKYKGSLFIIGLKYKLKNN